MLCQPKAQSRDVPGIWNPLPAFDTVKEDGQLANIRTVDKFSAAAKSGTLPAVTWIVPENKVSEHPPTVDQNGYGSRVTCLVISPYAKKGYIDHQTLSFDAYLKFIEDDFLGGQRIDPKTDGRPDPRPNVRENASQLGELAQDFDFTQTPRAPLVLPANPKPGPASIPGS